MSIYADIKDMVMEMLELSKIIRQVKYNRGSIDFDLPEIKLVLDEKIEAENFSIYRFLHQNNCKICFVKIKKPFGTRAFFNICILYGKTNTIIDIWDTFIIP